MDHSSREALFDDWAGSYDEFIARAEGFPFEGYERALNAILKAADPRPIQTVLDIGSGTGRLAALFAAKGCQVVGVDFSAEMLNRAARLVPSATFHHLDLLGEWNAIAGRRFDHIVSAYVFHEFDDEMKRTLLVDFARNHLAPAGTITVGDIAFSDQEQQRMIRERWGNRWDPDEHYWIADQAIQRFNRCGLTGHYRQVTPFAGVFHFHVHGSGVNAWDGWMED